MIARPSAVVLSPVVPQIIFFAAIVLVGVMSGCGVKAVPKSAEVKTEKSPAETKPPALSAETPPSSDTSAIDNLHDLATEPLKEPLSITDEKAGFEFRVPPGFRFPRSWDGDVDFDEQNKTLMTEYFVEPVDDASCRVAVFRVPAKLSALKEESELLQMAAQCAMSWDEDNLIQVTKQLGARELDFGDAPNQEWRVQANIGGKPLYARIVAFLIAGPTFDTDRICTVIYVDKTEEALDGENAEFFLASLNIYKVKVNNPT
ncbi:MAG: hypothetical protein SGI88_02225 [Candidatus Hydrogenedentes bacterium]|nr:hypothetical protein [Candidatus Hydrogenedentota bacterium]